MLAAPLNRACTIGARAALRRTHPGVLAQAFPCVASTLRTAHRSVRLSEPCAAPCVLARRASTLSSSVAAASTTAAAASAVPLPRVLHTIAEVRAMCAQVRRDGGSLGFVPTMGALHAGHVALAARSMQENTHTIASIFVNPTQFLAHEDLGSYPRTLESDLQNLGAIGVPFVFAPSVQEMYPTWPSFLTSVSMAGADATSEGAQRPGHFAGVATVVSKLLNIVQPTRAYFGQKDGMQCVVIRRLVRDLDFNVDVRICPTVRAKDGLALSSRNVYLTPEERKVAPVLYRALTAANDLYLSGERDSTRLKRAAQAVLESEPLGKAEYVSLADADSGKEIPDGAITSAVLNAQGEVQTGGAMLSLAYKLGKPRLIDNATLGVALKPGKD